LLGELQPVCFHIRTERLTGELNAQLRLSLRQTAPPN
jgi:hypothetical protein